jgi:outer membrane protein OmpA-like peptidoglycan-associated protein
VQFATDRADILPASYAMLDEIADVLRGRPELRVRVEGHTDGRGTIDHNLRLSQTRAESVRAYLGGKGVDQSHLDARGYGPTRPIADDKVPAGQEKNRRVEFVITAQ